MSLCLYRLTAWFVAWLPGMFMVDHGRHGPIQRKILAQKMIAMNYDDISDLWMKYDEVCTLSLWYYDYTDYTD